MLAALATAAGLAPLGLVRNAAAQDINLFELTRPVPLGDIVVGSANAPVTMIEYFSFSCGHCAEFHKTTYPVIKADYIDTGKVRFILREYPLNLPAAAASMLARCVGKDDPVKYEEIAGTLFGAQEQWVLRDTREQLRQIASKAGLDDGAFETCLANQETVNALQAGMAHANEVLKVDSTPTFFINGVRVKGAYPIEQFRRLIEARLKS